MNSERQQFIDEWAKKIKEGYPWRKEHNEFINAQVNQANDFYRRFLKEKGRERFKKITGASDVFIEEFSKRNALD